MFYFDKTKVDQSGDKSGDPWQVYSNPKNPELCHVIVLEKYLISHIPSKCKLSSFNRKQSIRTLHKNISQGHTLQQVNVSYSWCGGAFVRVPFVSEGSNNYVLVWMHSLFPYGVYLLEGFLDHGPIKGLVNLLQKSW